ncbi:hypothetical protein Tco_0921892, partial [Tanacetum coccineum]
VIRVVFNPFWLPAFPSKVPIFLAVKALEVSIVLFLEFEEVLRLLLVGSLSSSESDSDGGVTGLAISLPLCLVDVLELVEKDCFGAGAYDL